MLKVRLRIPTEGPNPITSPTSLQTLIRKENPQGKGAKIANHKGRIPKIIQFARSAAKLIQGNAEQEIQMCAIDVEMRDIMLDNTPTHPIIEMSRHWPRIRCPKYMRCKPNWKGLWLVKVGLKHQNLRRRSTLIQKVTWRQGLWMLWQVSFLSQIWTCMSYLIMVQHTNLYPLCTRTGWMEKKRR